MAPDDETRHDLFVLLERDTSRETVAALMRHIPTDGWPDFATKADLDAMKNELRVEMRDQVNRVLFWIVPLVVGGMGASITLVARAG